MLSPTSWEKRRAWLRQSRHWQTQVLEEEAGAVLQDVSDPEPSSLDDVFQEGKRQLDHKETSTSPGAGENVPTGTGLQSVGSGFLGEARPSGRLILMGLMSLKEEE